MGDRLTCIFVDNGLLRQNEAEEVIERTTLHGAIPEPLRLAHIIAGGGKRLRPALLLLTAGACGYQGRDHHVLQHAHLRLDHDMLKRPRDAVPGDRLRQLFAARYPW